ncbi:MAG: hypothetical protein U0350_43070 [Caldilineaceae bacterium]
MHEPPVIVNNTPLVALWALDKLALLDDLYSTVWIPPAVELEFLATDTSARQQALSQASWIQTVKLQDARHALAYVGLGLGEAEVLALAVEHDARLVYTWIRRS